MFHFNAAEFSEIREEQNEEQLCIGLTQVVMAEVPCLLTQAEMPRQDLTQHCNVAVNFMSYFLSQIQSPQRLKVTPFVLPCFLLQLKHRLMYIFGTEKLQSQFPGGSALGLRDVYFEHVHNLIVLTFTFSFLFPASQWTQISQREEMTQITQGVAG